MVLTECLEKQYLELYVAMDASKTSCNYYVTTYNNTESLDFGINQKLT